MKLLVFQHIACEHPGRLRHYLAQDGVPWQAVELDEGDPIPALEDFDALWVMGGPMDVWDTDDHPWLVAEKAAIRHWVRDLKRPFLGLCLGHQLLADALGGVCVRQNPPEIGIMDVELTAEGRRDPIFVDMAERQKVLQWHSVQVATAPKDAVVLAKSDICPIQAMRIGANAWSMQYHVEVEADTVGNWGEVPAYRAALEDSLGGGALAAMEQDATANLNSFLVASAQLYRNFVAAVQTERG